MAIDITNSAEYSEVISKINLWYGNDAQKVVNIANQYELSPDQLTSDWLSGSGFEPWYTSSHGIAGYNSVGTSGINYATGMQEAMDSNAGSVTQVQLKTPVQTTINQQTGKVQASSGLTHAGTGTLSPLTFIQKEVLPAVSAAGLGISLGKVIDSTLYNLNPNFWDNNGMSTLNPETWNTITQDYPDGALKRAFNTIFGLNPNTGETQMYLDANAAAYLAQYMQEQGVFDTSTDSTITSSDYEHPPCNLPISFATVSCSGEQVYYNGRNWYVSPTIGADQNGNELKLASSAVRTYKMSNAKNGNYNYICWENKDYQWDRTGIIYYRNGRPDGIASESSSLRMYAANSLLTYYNSVLLGSDSYGVAINLPTANAYYSEHTDQLSWLLEYANSTQGGGGIDGITDQDGATQPNFSGCETPADYLNALRTQYPDLFNNAVTQSVVNPDGTTSTNTYLPIGTPSKNNNGNKTQPVTNTNNSGNKQDDSKANPSNLDLTGLENLIKTLTDTISKTGTPTNPTNPDPTGTGNTPPVVAPTGSASALWSVYNPSQAELNSFGAWLWSSNFIDQILKLFNNPMQSIIGVHKIFASPPVSGSGSITVGYLNSGVSANLVSGQYTTVNCGTVKVSEQFGNVFDYTDTHIRLYLPFVGIVDLDTADVMRGSVSVVYHVDVITGACLAEVKVTRDGSGGTLYQYAGDAAVRYPISSGSYMGVVAGIASAVGGVASAVMTGGATLPLAAGAVAGGISGAQTQVQHSGNFSGNAGAMGGKKPYLIIERPQTMIADDFEGYQGKGANVRRTVGQMSGYFKFSDVHTDSINGAAQSEIEAIRAALESGVIA